MSKNISDIVNRRYCVGCGVCEVACRSKAIRMKFDRNAGLYIPQINPLKCINCGICRLVCPGLNFLTELQTLEINRISKIIASKIGFLKGIYIGFAQDHNIRFEASSGGVVTALLRFLLDEKYIDGAIVAKILPGGTPLAKAFIATKNEDISLAMGSKYCPVLLSDALRQLENQKRYAFVGLPCHIYAVKKFIKLKRLPDDPIKLYIGLFCGGTPSYKGTQYLMKKYGLRGHYITELKYRGGGWPGRMLVKANSNVTKSIPFIDYWVEISPWFLLDLCLVCLNGFNNLADISCGDAWLPEYMRKDKLGTSIILTRSDLGESILQMARKKGYIEFQPVSVSSILSAQQSMLFFKHFRIAHRLKFLNLIGKGFNFPREIMSTKSTFIFDELMLYIGRFLASNEKLWNLFEVYKFLRKVESRLVKIIGKLK